MSTTASSSTARFTPRLPTEIWTRIFRTATGKRVSAPWNVPSDQSRLPGYLSVKLAIVLVCKRWRALGLRFLYEDIVIRERTFDGLLSGLERIEAFEEETNGRYVRRIVFSATRVDMDMAILKCCPNVKFLVKPPSTKDDDGSVNGAFPFPDRSITSFESVKCIVWSLQSPYTYRDTPHSQESASFLWHIVQIMPNIRFLSLAGDPSPSYMMVLSDLHLYLRQLQGLWVENINASGRQGMFEWTLPALTHLWADESVVNQSLLNSGQLCLIELLPVVRPLSTAISIVRILGSCPRLRELGYDIRYTMPPNFPEGFILQASLLECVRLYSSFGVYDSPLSVFHHVESHLYLLCGPLFPSLRRVVIHECSVVRIKAQIDKNWEARFRAQNCTLEWSSDKWSKDDINF